MDLTVERLRVMLSGRSVLDEIGLVLRPGRVTAILGPNGAGKSTLIKAMAALVAVADGDVRLGGRDIAALPPRSFRDEAGVSHRLLQDAFQNL